MPRCECREIYAGDGDVMAVLCAFYATDGCAHYAMPAENAFVHAAPCALVIVFADLAAHKRCLLTPRHGETSHAAATLTVHFYDDVVKRLKKTMPRQQCRYFARLRTCVSCLLTIRYVDPLILNALIHAGCFSARQRTARYTAADMPMLPAATTLRV